MCLAAVSHLPCLQWLLSEDVQCSFHPSLSVDIAETGNLEALQWASTYLGEQLMIDEGTMHAAACSGELDMVKWLRTGLAPPCAWDSECMKEAAWDANLEIDEVLLDTVCCPYFKSCSEAVR